MLTLRTRRLIFKAESDNTKTSACSALSQSPSYTLAYRGFSLRVAPFFREINKLSGIHMIQIPTDVLEHLCADNSSPPWRAWGARNFIEQYLYEWMRHGFFCVTLCWLLHCWVRDKVSENIRDFIEFTSIKWFTQRWRTLLFAGNSKRFVVATFLFACNVERTLCNCLLWMSLPTIYLLKWSPP